MADMKTFLSSTMPNQYCRCRKEDILGREIPNLHDSYIQYYSYSTVVLYIKSKETSVVIYNCTYSSGHLIPIIQSC